MGDEKKAGEKTAAEKKPKRDLATIVKNAVSEALGDKKPEEKKADGDPAIPKKPVAGETPAQEKWDDWGFDKAAPAPAEKK